MDDSIEISNESEIQHSVIPADGTIKYDFMTSLQNIAIAKIVSILWMNEKTQKEIGDFLQIVGGFKKHIERERIENSIVAKISHLNLPDNFSEKMMDVVKDLGRSIICWLRYHDIYIFCHNDSKYSAVDLMNNIIWTARGKIDYERTAKNIFANLNNSLDDETKCKLACNYCLEDEIKLLASKIVEMFDYENSDSEPMVYFWAKHITGESIRRNDNSSNRRQNNTNFNEYIMQRLISDERKMVKRTWNDVPITFMWNRLSEEEKVREIKLLVNSIENTDYLFSLLSNLCCSLQQKVFNECHLRILRCMITDWLWGEYFIPTTFIVLELFESCDHIKHWGVLVDIIYDSCINCEDVKTYMCDEYKSLFKYLWREASSEFKDFIQDYDINSVEWFLACRLSWERDTDIAEIILEDLNTEKKRNIVFGEHGVKRCINFITSERWDMLDLFLKHTLSTEEDISHLKKKLVQDGQRQFESHFSKCQSFDKLDRFLKWAFESEEERDEFRENLNCTNFTNSSFQNREIPPKISYKYLQTFLE